MFAVHSMICSLHLAAKSRFPSLKKELRPITPIIVIARGMLETAYW